MAAHGFCLGAFSILAAGFGFLAVNVKGDSS